MGSLEVIKKGFLTTVQDLGRIGVRRIGVPTSGAMDIKAMKDGNKIVGNSDWSPVFEHTFYGGVYVFYERALISITGATCTPILNGIEIPQYKAIEINKWDKLEIKHPKRGCRSYMAIQGVLDIPKVLHSYSTYLEGKFGGFKGRALDSGDKISWKFEGNDFKLRDFPSSEMPYFSSKISINIKKGPEFDLLDEQAQNEFFDSIFSVNSQSNRMGIRLEGQKIKYPTIEMVSAPVIPGIIQIPASGNPIILMRDCQTIGGYPRIGIVEEEDLWRLGQVKAGDQIRFKFFE